MSDQAAHQFLYFLLFDEKRADLNLRALFAYLQESVWITRWGCYGQIPNVYLIQTPLRLSELRTRLDPHFNDKDFLICSANIDLMEGRIPSSGWDWIIKAGGRLATSPPNTVAPLLEHKK